MRVIHNDGMDDDEVLTQEVREQLRDQGLDEDAVEFTLECMSDEGILRGRFF